VLEDLGESPPLGWVARQKHQAARVLSRRRERETILLRDLLQEGVWHLNEHAGTVSGVDLATARATMIEVAQDLDGLLQDPVGFAALHVHDETDAAGLVLVPGVVQALLAGLPTLTTMGAAREALGETRRVVGLLRNGDELPERVPQPGLARLDDLVEAARQSGLSVEPLVVGVPRPLAVGVDLSAYRIVQEAMSNAARYAPGSRIRVAVRYGGQRLQVSVTDDGSDAPGAVQAGGGHGLVGMRERVAMLGGTLSAGPGEGGGFEVVADLPYGDAPQPA